MLKYTDSITIKSDLNIPTTIGRVLACLYETLVKRTLLINIGSVHAQICSCRYISFDLASILLKCKGAIRLFARKNSVSSQLGAVAALPMTAQMVERLSLRSCIIVIWI